MYRMSRGHFISQITWHHNRTGGVYSVLRGTRVTQGVGALGVLASLATRNAHMYTHTSTATSCLFAPAAFPTTWNQQREKETFAPSSRRANDESSKVDLPTLCQLVSSNTPNTYFHSFSTGDTARKCGLNTSRMLPVPTRKCSSSPHLLPLRRRRTAIRWPPQGVLFSLIPTEGDRRMLHRDKQKHTWPYVCNTVCEAIARLP